jgi:tetratricopeptide (TPR) repeat protein
MEAAEVHRTDDVPLFDLGDCCMSAIHWKFLYDRWLLKLVWTLGALLMAQPSGAQWLRSAEVLLWETDYNTARKRAAEKGLALFVVIGTQPCYYCRKLEHGPLREAALVSLLQRHFVPLKIDAQREPELARALRVQAYPTIVLAGPDGKIHAFIEGYVDSNRLEEHCKRALLAIATADGSARDFEQAAQAINNGDYARAVSLLRPIVREAGEQPVGHKARQLLEQIERQAASTQQRATQLLAQGETLEALDVLGTVLQRYAGTAAAEQAAEQLRRLTAQTQVQQQLRQRTARDLLASAREDFRQQRYYDCLLKCEQLRHCYASEPESVEAGQLATAIQKNPQYLARACEQLQQQTLDLSLRLAEAWQAQGRLNEAAVCYERVLRWAPDSPQGRTAAAALSQLHARGTGTPTAGASGSTAPTTPTSRSKP